MMQQPRPLVLASQSPRRVELMRQAGLEFETLTFDVDEAHDPALTPEQLTIENALRKAMRGAQLRPDAWVIGADTLVYVDGHPLGKPRDLDEALSMLRRLSGREHEVCTGVVIAFDGGHSWHGFHVITEVGFKSLSDDAIRAYHRLVNPLDKAGAYGIQESSDTILDHYIGSWSNVMGLPMERLLDELRNLSLNSGMKLAAIERKERKNEG